jgi:hypothetical protein
MSKLISIAARTTSLYLAKAAVAELVAAGFQSSSHVRESDNEIFVVVYTSLLKANILNHRGSETHKTDVYDLETQWVEFLTTAKGYIKPKLASIGGYQAEVQGNKVHFGCQSFTMTELKTVKKLLQSPVNAAVTIGGTMVNEKMIDEMISALEASKGKGQDTRGWAVGDIIPDSLWRSSRDIWGLSGYHWERRDDLSIHDDRTVEKIEMKGDRLAILIGGTRGVWVSVESMPRK